MPVTGRPNARTFRRTAALGGVALGLLGSVLAATTADASVGSDDFRANEVYRGDFPDPGIMRDGSTYYAFATNTGGKLLPAMSSTDLRTWKARYSNTRNWWENDALAKAPSWAKAHYGHGKWRVSTWAPSVKKVAGRYVAAYAAPVSENPRKMCVTTAYASKPLGPYVDRSRGPIVCPGNQGAIDPMVFARGSRVPYLLWKTEGIPRREPTRLWIRRMNADATSFDSAAPAHNLLTTALPWEGNVIENPSMVRFQHRDYLFYSANRYDSSAYAIGYAICRRAWGPCVRQSRSPLLATGGAVSGPGGPDAFVDANGQLRLAYAAWDRGRVGYPSSTGCRKSKAGCNQRRMHVATVAALPDGRLTIADRG